VTRYVVWLLRYLWSCISKTSYGVFMYSPGVMYVCSWCVARRLLVVSLPTLGWVVIVSELVSLMWGRFSWFTYLYHVAWMICVGVVCLGSFLCSWYAGSVRVDARVDRAVYILWRGRGLSPLCSFA